MGKTSTQWIRYLARVIKYYAAFSALAIIVIDIIYIYDIGVYNINLIAGSSLISCILNYIAVRGFGYCYVQRHLIWMTFYNLIYNSMVMQSSWKYKVHGEIVIIFLLSALLLWAIIHYINEIRRGEIPTPCDSIKLVKNKNQDFNE
jgi:hypothetical protein